MWKDNQFLTDLHKAVKQGVENAKSKGVKFGQANEKWRNNPNDTRIDEEKAFAWERGLIMRKINKNNRALFSTEKLTLIRLYRQVSQGLKDNSTDSPAYFENWTRKTAKITIKEHKAVAKLINEDKAAEGVFYEHISPFKLRSIWSAIILSIERRLQYQRDYEQFNKIYEQFKNK